MMMTKKTLQLLATTALLAGLGFNTVTASAAEVAGSTDTPKTESVSDTTTATVTLAAGDDNGGNVAGSIHLVSAPDITLEGKLTGDHQTLNGIKFATHEFSKDEAASGDAGSLVVRNAGQLTGWNVNVSNSAFKTADEKQGLLASSLTLKDSTISAKDGQDKDGNQSAAPVANDVTLLSGGTDNKLVFHANANEGIGTWMSKYSDKTSELNIAAGNKAGAYTSVLTWTLSNAPSGVATAKPSTPATTDPATPAPTTPATPAANK